MPDYRRWFVPGGTYFFTVVTFDRRPIFCSPSAVALLGTVLREVRVELPFDTIAVSVLPDHLHTVWSLPRGDCDFPGRWNRIKGRFSRAWLDSGGEESMRPDSYERRRQFAVWQRRFWEHVIRDERDLEAHVDYIHYNPLKHGLVRTAADWPWTSFHRYVRAGHYPSDWGKLEPDHIARLNLE